MQSNAETIAPADSSETWRSQRDGRIELPRYLLIVGQLALLTVLLWQYQIESAAFLRLAVLAFAGFAIHALLPLRFRLPFFLALSLASIALVMNPGNALWIVGLGLALIGICHLPVAFAWRMTLLVVAAGVLVALRAKWIDGPMSDAIWPILGSMFMFRLIVYVYDLRHDSSPVSPVRTLAYFFMLPNACFPLFPVVDYRSFNRSYYDQDAYRTYQVGVDWMVRGVIHLLLYRFVYLYLALDPAEVFEPGELVRYLIATFLLYFRISGQFHLVIGMLYLFGFRLPETHHLYLLASSFTDFWRRINIYWKDFIQKLVFNPAYFMLRKLGEARAMAIATAITAVLTWLLHSYQWFWLRGDFPIAWQDGIFWMGLALLVVVSAVREFKRGRDRSLGSTGETWRGRAMRGLRTVGVFFSICILWSVWTSESIGQW
ncbi:MAG: hypothetical protein ACREXY_11210, partial [Gammaproteobacteria bacterium]